MPGSPSRSGPLVAQRLRELTLEALHHPRGQPHLSAASGLVCANGCVYVIADDEHHLAVFSDAHAPGVLHRVRPGDLPHGKKARKRVKPDLEVLAMLPAWRASKGGALLALGSGSRPNRSLGVVIPLTAQGRPGARVRRIDLQPMYGPLRARLGEINVEGAMLVGDAFVLLNRGIQGRTENVAVRYRWADVSRLLEGACGDLQPLALRRYELGAIGGVGLGFTDAAALPGGGWVFSAVAESTGDAVADGRCLGCVIGVVDAHGGLRSLRRLAGRPKVEGIDVQVDDAGVITLCLVTDADDPARSALLLRATL